MYRLPPVIGFLVLAVGAFAQSPHGANFKVNCAACHTSAGWEIPYDAWDRNGPVFSRVTGWRIGWDTMGFDHNKTNFPLQGQHTRVDCRSCHETLVFSDAKTGCISCHTDMHKGTVGTDCARCHTTNNWLVDNIAELHQDNGFPLLGAHALANCTDCHKSESALQFNRIGNACINCHASDYATTANPDHKNAGFSTNCVDCHDVTRFDWNTSKINHDFFPLTKGHEIADCAKCHTGGNYANTSPECISCHKTDYDASVNPSHTVLHFSQNCVDCHTTDLNWMPAKFAQHDAAYFPIYSGTHQGTWNQCADCHNNPSDFGEFTCTSCHTNPTTDNQHNGVNGYTYNSPACLACHPSGSATDVFDHSKTNFPLTGAHVAVNCTQCHTTGYAGTPTDCASCHTTDFNQSSNPNHVALGIPKDCASCHTTAGWSPASFAIHNNYYPLNGAHATIANECATCHKGNYTNTPNTCAGCHTPDYNQTTNPNHAAAKFPTDCKTCHNETTWVPSTFDHNSFYPLNGAHAAIAKDCNTCHNGNYTNTPNTCAGCHTPDYNQTTNPNHAAAKFPTDCKSCHSETAWTPATFDHDGQYFPIYSGAHKGEWNQCADCHTNPSNYAEFTCTTCHANPQTNNQHTGVNGYTYNSSACLACHPTGSAANVFDHNSTKFPLTGAHKTTGCMECHTTGFAGTPTECAACHTPDFNLSTNPNHVALAIPKDCAGCHTTNAWAPATFAIHSNYYALNGAHALIANECATCHKGNYNNTPNTCAGCHIDDYNQTTNPNHVTAKFPTDCKTCHSETAWVPSTFNHSTVYPLNGAHATIACSACHKNGNYNTPPPTTCVGCHQAEYNQTTNPNHAAAGFPTTCKDCHSETAWTPATFNHDGMYFPIYSGKHKGKWDQCTDCHTTAGNYAQFSCTVCHTNPQTNNNHQGVSGYSYSSPACYSCHPKGN